MTRYLVGILTTFLTTFVASAVMLTTTSEFVQVTAATIWLVALLTCAYLLITAPPRGGARHVRKR